MVHKWSINNNIKNTNLSDDMLSINGLHCSVKNLLTVGF